MNPLIASYHEAQMNNGLTHSNFGVEKAQKMLTVPNGRGGQTMKVPDPGPGRLDDSTFWRLMDSFGYRNQKELDEVKPPAGFRDWSKARIVTWFNDPHPQRESLIQTFEEANARDRLLKGWRSNAPKPSAGETPKPQAEEPKNSGPAVGDFVNFWAEGGATPQVDFSGKVTNPGTRKKVSKRGKVTAILERELGQRTLPQVAGADLDVTALGVPHLQAAIRQNNELLAVMVAPSLKIIGYGKSLAGAQQVGDEKSPIPKDRPTDAPNLLIRREYTSNGKHQGAGQGALLAERRQGKWEHK